MSSYTSELEKGDLLEEDKDADQFKMADDHVDSLSVTSADDMEDNEQLLEKQFEATNASEHSDDNTTYVSDDNSIHSS